MPRKSKNSLAASAAHQFPTSTPERLCPEAKPGPPAGVSEEPPKRKPILTRLAEMEDLLADETEPISGKELAYLLADARGEIEDAQTTAKDLEDAQEELKLAEEKIEKLEDEDHKRDREEADELEKERTAFRRNVFSESLSRPGTFELRMIDDATEIDNRALDLIRTGRARVETETVGGMEQGQCGPVTIIRLLPPLPTRRSC